jgi:hypothetical protein
MTGIVKFVGFVLVLFSFGFTSSLALLNLNSTVVLILLSFSIGIGFYIFLCHALSFVLGPSVAVIYSFFILLIVSICLAALNLRKCFSTLKEINVRAILLLFGSALLISVTSFFAVSKMGIFDVEFHVPLALTMFHNDVYPPKDFFRPEFVLLYHHGGDLFAGAVHKICNVRIDTAFELVSSFSALLMYFGFFSLAYLLTTHFKTSLISGLCTYFGGGLLWLDAVIRFSFNSLPAGSEGWSLLQTFFNIGLHGGIFNAPSVSSFTSTYSLGLPLLITSIVLFFLDLKEGSHHLKAMVRHGAVTAICLFSLFLCAEWLFLTFLVGSIAFVLFYFLRTRERSSFISLAVIIILFIVLNATLGNPLFLQEGIQHIGRANVFNLGVKERLFLIPSWGRLTSGTMVLDAVSFFSWKAIAEFGISYILFPFSVLYLFKSRNNLAILLFLMGCLTFPIPLFLEYRLNPVEFNRLFSFGNSIFILLITCSIFYFGLSLKRWFIIAYVIVLTLTPVSDLVLSAVISPYVSFNKSFNQALLDGLKKVRSPRDFSNQLKNLYKVQEDVKRQVMPLEREDVLFLRKQSKPLEVAVSNHPTVPLYAGTYTLIPARKYAYKDLIYTSFDSIYRVVFKSLDREILRELNVRWVLMYTSDKYHPDETFYSSISGLSDKVFEGEMNLPENEKGKVEIFHIREFDEIPSSKERRVAWVLSDKNGGAAEMSLLGEKKITLFSTSKDARNYLQERFRKEVLKKETVTSQLIVIDELNSIIKKNNPGVSIEKRF